MRGKVTHFQLDGRWHIARSHLITAMPRMRIFTSPFHEQGEDGQLV